ncbi:MAG: hypothetical protein ABR863_03465 [Roseiarcus sp.]|jgi:predicted dehydrogenase
MKVAIFGSGFGLYGYLPALLIGSGAEVVLPDRYKARLEDRSDVRHLTDRIEWVEDETAALDRVCAIILSQRPTDQVRWLANILPRTAPSCILMEKPLAPDPVQAKDILQRARDSGKRIRIGYTFRYAPWAKRFAHALERPWPNGEVTVTWRFRAHHYATDVSNWKRFVSVGGGALRFYGIHLIALLAECGYNDALSSSIAATRPDEAEIWEAVLAGLGLPTCRVVVDSNAEHESFSVTAGPDGRPLADLKEPFEEVERHGPLDPRVDVLARLCREFLAADATPLSWYEDSIALWRKVENQTEITVRLRHDRN